MFYEEYTDGTWNNGRYISSPSLPETVTVSSVAATSTLTEGRITHSAESAVDGNLTTAWCEGASGQGIGESISFKFNKLYIVDKFTINAGYQLGPTYYYEINSRPADIRITYSDGSSETHTLADIKGEQTVYLDRPVVTNSIMITIESVYPGTLCEDTLISEILFWSVGSKTAFICEWGT